MPFCTLYPIVYLGYFFLVMVHAGFHLHPTSLIQWRRSGDGHVHLGTTGTNAVAGSSDNRCGFKEWIESWQNEGKGVMETWRFEGRDAARHETMFFLLLYGPGIAFICQAWTGREEFTTGCCRMSLLLVSCFRMNLRAVMSIGCCTSCSGCTCGQLHGSSLLRPCCSRCRAPKSGQVFSTRRKGTT